MKKSFIILSGFVGILFSVFLVFANQSVNVSAVVNSANHAPVILSVTPSSDPKLLGRDKIQNYTIYFRDDEKDPITSYTITPASGYANPIGDEALNLSSYDSASGAYINFTYISPSTIPATNPTTITITINDGPNLVSKDIRLYIY